VPPFTSDKEDIEILRKKIVETPAMFPSEMDG
jgi:hypothetical protein